VIPEKTIAASNQVRDVILSGYSEPQNVSTTSQVEYTALWSEINVYRGADDVYAAMPSGSIDFELISASGPNGTTCPLSKCFKSFSLSLDISGTLSISTQNGNSFLKSLWTPDADIVDYTECPLSASIQRFGNYEVDLANLISVALSSNASVPLVYPAEPNSGILIISNAGQSDEFGVWNLTYRAINQSGNNVRKLRRFTMPTRYVQFQIEIFFYNADRRVFRGSSIM
jgi:hypothetical protein